MNQEQHLMLIVTTVIVVPIWTHLITAWIHDARNGNDTEKSDAKTMLFTFGFMWTSSLIFIVFAS